MNDGDLKLCPFCGGEAEIYTPAICMGDDDADVDWMRPVCKGCGIGGLVVRFRDHRRNSKDFMRAKTNAIAAWNTRADAKAGEGDILPCDVKLPPATTISAGCGFDTLRLALSMEGRPRHFEERQSGRFDLPDITRPPADAPPVKQSLTSEDAVRDALLSELGDAYDCGRVWEAWSVGTMGEDDFSPISDRVDDIVGTVMAALQKGSGR